MYQGNKSLDVQVSTALAGWAEAIRSHDRATLEWIHDEDFTCIELGGTFMDKATHIAMEMQARDIEMEFFDVKNREFDDIVITWARQTLRGVVPGHDFNEDVSDAALDGIEFVFTLVWRKTADGLRVYTFHASSV